MMLNTSRRNTGLWRFISAVDRSTAPAARSRHALATRSSSSLVMSAMLNVMISRPGRFRR